MGLQQTLKALADPIRREILNMLKKRRMSAGENSFSTKLTPLFWRKQCFGLQL